MFNRERESPPAYGATRADLHGWYADALQPKVARAVAQGRIEPGRACELHRRMTDLLHADSIPRIGAEASR